MSELLQYQVDDQGIATITWNMTSHPTNVLNSDSLTLFSEFVDKAIADDAVKGVVITSGLNDFIVGADLRMLRNAAKSTAEEIFNACRELQGLLRRYETSGKPFVAAINGNALGGGLEVTLACHHRVVADNPKIQLGLPEVKLGLLPGAGGTQRLPRMIGAREALPFLTQGTSMNPEAAENLGVVDKVVPADKLLDAARAYILEGGSAKQPWDKKRFKLPGGPVQSPKGAEVFMGGNALLAKATWGNYPAPAAILSSVYHGLQLTLDQGLKYEARQFTKLARGAVAQNMIRTLFFGINDANKLRKRPKDVPTQTFKKVGILGAGMMGAGIAYVSARANMEVVLIDVSQESADRGKQYSVELLQKRVDRGRLTPEKRDATLARITPTTDYALLEGADIIVEAVFENREIKRDVTEKSEAVIPATAIFASNTSTLPITGLAEASKRPENFIGLHFFSPVDKMPLVEIIVGEKTTDETLARSMDYVKAIRKTPIVVNDSRGFYTSRVFSTYVTEGLALLAEGVAPALIENAGKLAGMPVGPLALADEVSVQLMYSIREQTKRDLGDNYQEHPANPVIDTMVNTVKRIGKKAKAGFYDYPPDARKHLWAGLAEHFPVADNQPDVETVKKRMLHIQAIETIRCLEENVVKAADDADVGSILGWGFAPFHGGVISYAHTVGLPTLLEDCEAFAKAYGERFEPPKKLRDMVAAGEHFYD